MCIWGDERDEEVRKPSFERESKDAPQATKKSKKHVRTASPSPHSPSTLSKTESTDEQSSKSLYRKSKGLGRLPAEDVRYIVEEVLKRLEGSPEWSTRIKLRNSQKEYRNAESE